MIKLIFFLSTNTWINWSLQNFNRGGGNYSLQDKQSQFAGFSKRKYYRKIDKNRRKNIENKKIDCSGG